MMINNPSMKMRLLFQGSEKIYTMPDTLLLFEYFIPWIYFVCLTANFDLVNVWNEFLRINKLAHGMYSCGLYFVLLESINRSIK